MRRRVAPEALREDAYTRLPHHQERAIARAELIRGARTPIRAGVRSVKAIGWACTLFCVLCSLAALWAGRWQVAPFFVLGVALGVYVLLSSGHVELSAEVIAEVTPLGRYEMRWDEVESIEVDALGQGLVFNGGGRRLAIPGMGCWSGAERERMAELLAAKVEQLGIKVVQMNALLRWSKGTKVGKGGRHLTTR